MVKILSRRVGWSVFKRTLSEFSELIIIERPNEETMREAHRVKGELLYFVQAMTKLHVLL